MFAAMRPATQRELTDHSLVCPNVLCERGNRISPDFGVDHVSSGRTDRHRISRRTVLTGTAFALAPVATMVSQTAAQVKFSRTTAKYQDRPKGDQRCEGCANFQPPNACKFVEGQISPNGWCQLFVKKT